MVSWCQDLHHAAITALAKLDTAIINLRGITATEGDNPENYAAPQHTEWLPNSTTSESRVPT